MRVVFDTNVLVSALVFPGGRGDDALQCIVEERDELLVSRAIVDELLGVLARKFARDAEELARASSAYVSASRDRRRNRAEEIGL